MHPIERLRYVARAGSVPVGPLVRESATALGAFADDPGALLTACRRLLDRRPHSAPLVWLAARMLTGPDPRSEAWDVVEQLERDPTAAELEFAVPEGARVLVIGAPEITTVALARRPDLVVLSIDGAEAGLGTAAPGIDLVILESECIGPERALTPSGSRAGAVAADGAGIPLWLVAGVGRQLPSQMWDRVIERVDGGERSDRRHESVPLSLTDRIVTPSGLRTPAEATRSVDCPVVPELFGAG